MHYKYGEGAHSLKHGVTWTWPHPLVTPICYFL